MTKDEPPHPETDELFSRLVRAGASEKPPSRSMSRTLSALGLGATSLGVATSAGASGAGGAGTLTLAVVGKWAGFGVASGVVAASVAYGTARLPSRPSERSSPPAPASVPLLAQPPSQGVAFPARAPAARGAHSPTPVVRPASPKFATPEVEAGVPLSAELVLVDRGRALLQRGDARAALSALDRYERDFAEARLLPEVLYLRMEALAQLGLTRQASAVAARLAQSFPRSPHAARAHAVLAGAPQKFRSIP